MTPLPLRSLQPEPTGWLPATSSTAPASRKVDAALFRNVIFAERYTLQFRGEFTNLFNMVSLSNPTSSLANLSTAGNIRSAQAMRQTQLGLRLTF